MIKVSESEFTELVQKAVENLPERYLDNMKNVGFVVEDEPSLEQRHKMNLQDNQSLFGLYEGVPLTQRGAGYQMVLPDKITIFQNPLSWASSDLADLKERIQNTVWHEVAHHFGLAHSRIHALEDKHKKQKGV